MVGAWVGGVCEHLPSAAWQLHPALKIEFWYPHTHPAVVRCKLPDPPLKIDFWYPPPWSSQQTQVKKNHIRPTIQFDVKKNSNNVQPTLGAISFFAVQIITW